MPTEEKSIKQEIEDARLLAIERCVTAGGDRETITVVEVDVIPVSYTMNGAASIFIRVVGDLVNEKEASPDSPEDILDGEIFYKLDLFPTQKPSTETSKGSSHGISDRVDLKSYRPRIEGDLWYLSVLDVQFLAEGTGVLGVGSCGEPYPSYLSLLEILRTGGKLTIRRQSTFPDDGVALVCGFMVNITKFQVDQC